MTTRMLIRDRVVYQNGPLGDRRHQPGAGEASMPIAYDVAPLRSGHVFLDKELGLSFRVVAGGRLSPADGWGDAAFWLGYMRVDWPAMRRLVEMGCFDAAVEEGSTVRRYRCLNLTRARSLANELRAARWRKR